MKRPVLTPREQELLNALMLMTGWVIQKLEPVMSGTGAPYEALVRDMKAASNAISNATGGNEE